MLLRQRLPYSLPNGRNIVKNTTTSSTIRLGDKFNSRTGVGYTVTKIFDDGGFEIERSSTGKTVKIPGGLIERTRQRAERGDYIALQANETQNGISYTSAITEGVVFSLGLRQGWVK